MSKSLITISQSFNKYVPFSKNLIIKDDLEMTLKMNKVLTDVNDLIVDYTKNTLMPRCGFESDRCETNFKGEMLIDSILFIDVKRKSKGAFL